MRPYKTILHLSPAPVAASQLTNYGRTPVGILPPLPGAPQTQIQNNMHIIFKNLCTNILYGALLFYGWPHGHGK